uniref:EF-hand domain-containing protein n=1 Tax=Schistosoma mansoni TaxID=6183 RepID=A0A3Q0KEQ8_SCHMA
MSIIIENLIVINFGGISLLKLILIIMEKLIKMNLKNIWINIVHNLVVKMLKKHLNIVILIIMELLNLKNLKSICFVNEKLLI